MKFEELGLAETLLRAVDAQGYASPTKIQAAAIPPILEGRDLLGCAQTGTGKTAAFALPILQRLGRAECRVNGRGRKVRTPGPRPHARTGAANRREFSGLRPLHRACGRTVVYGGVGQAPQVRALNAGVDILVATPGRLLDLMQQGFVDLSHVEVLVLDEADRMLDMGFIHDLRRIVAKVPSQRQTLLFSATMPAAIRQLADQWLTRPGRRAGRAGVDARSRRSGSRCSLSIRPRSCACSRIGCDRRPGRGRWCSRGPSTARTKWPSCC